MIGLRSCTRKRITMSKRRAEHQITKGSATPDLNCALTLVRSDDAEEDESVESMVPDIRAVHSGLNSQSGTWTEASKEKLAGRQYATTCPQLIVPRIFKAKRKLVS